MKYLSNYNLVFQGSNTKLYKDSNENFLGAIQMMVEFDDIM